MDYLKLIRFKNLVIVILTQILVYFSIIHPFLVRNHLNPVLSIVDLSILILVTVIITAAGFVINDIFDVDTDQLNKPEKLYVGNTISKRSAYLFYFILICIGFGFSCYLAIKINKPLWLIIYPIAVLGLHFYSSKYKGSILIGNIIVAIFCAGVAGILCFAEQSAIGQLKTINHSAFKHLIAWNIIYMAYALLTTLIRELIKDMEDFGGDKANKIQTLPVAFGIKKSKILGYFYLFLLLGSLMYFSFLLINFYNLPSALVFLVVVIIPAIYLTYKFLFALEKPAFSAVSAWSKYLMAAGLLFLLIIKLIGII